MYWLLEQSILNKLEQAKTLGLVPTSEQQIQFEARAAGSSGGSRLLVIAGDQAEIEIVGVLTQRPDILAFLFGGGNTTYPDIVSAIAEAAANDNVKNITFAINSPGGQFSGLFDLLDAIAAMKKPTRAVVSGQAASAAFAIASQADEIIAVNRAASFGSIGVVAVFSVDKSVVEIASTDAPNKRPDVTTDEGKAIVRAQLDDMHAIFVAAIAEGRGVTVDDVNKNFGRGAVLLADGALKSGMIDSIQGPKIVKAEIITTPAASGAESETHSMDLATLKVSHATLFLAVVALGVSQERDRVSAHLILGETSGAMDVASKAIKDGTEMTAALQATYMAAGMNKRDIVARATDDAAVAAAAAAAGNGGQSADDLKKQAEAKVGAAILAAAANSCGVDVGV